MELRYIGESNLFDEWIDKTEDFEVINVVDTTAPLMIEELYHSCSDDTMEVYVVEVDNFDRDEFGLMYPETPLFYYKIDGTTRVILSKYTWKGSLTNIDVDE